MGAPGKHAKLRRFALIIVASAAHARQHSFSLPGCRTESRRTCRRASPRKPASSTVTSRLDSSSLIVGEGAVLSAKASVRAAWARQRGTQSPPTRAPGRAWRRPREKRRCRWPSVAAAHGWASERRGRYQSFLTRLELPRERSGLSPRRLGHRLHLERLLDKSDCLCLASGLGLCVCLACQSLRLVKWSGFVRLERFRQVGGLERFRQVGAVSSGWSDLVRFLPAAPTRRAYRWPDRARSSSSPNSQPSSAASSAACTSARRS